MGLNLVGGVVTRAADGCPSVTSLAADAVIRWTGKGTCFRSLRSVAVLAPKSKSLLPVAGSIVVGWARAESLLFLVMPNESKLHGSRTEEEDGSNDGRRKARRVIFASQAKVHRVRGIIVAGQAKPTISEAIG